MGRISKYFFAFCQETAIFFYNTEKYAPAPEGKELFGKKIDVGREGSLLLFNFMLKKFVESIYRVNNGCSLTFPYIFYKNNLIDINKIQELNH